MFNIAPRIMAHLSDEIRAFHAADMAARRKYWIGGVPTPQDLQSVAKAVARKLRITEDDVAKALAPVVTFPQP